MILTRKTSHGPVLPCRQRRSMSSDEGPSHQRCPLPDLLPRSHCGGREAENVVSPSPSPTLNAAGERVGKRGEGSSALAVMKHSMSKSVSICSRTSRRAGDREGGEDSRCARTVVRWWAKARAGGGEGWEAGRGRERCDGTSRSGGGDDGSGQRGEEIGFRE